MSYTRYVAVVQVQRVWSTYSDLQHFYNVVFYNEVFNKVKHNSVPEYSYVPRNCVTIAQPFGVKKHKVTVAHEANVNVLCYRATGTTTLVPHTCTR